MVRLGILIFCDVEFTEEYKFLNLRIISTQIVCDCGFGDD
jgi:hypothetical protein